MKLCAITAMLLILFALLGMSNAEEVTQDGQGILVDGERIIRFFQPLSPYPEPSPEDPPPEEIIACVDMMDPSTYSGGVDGTGDACYRRPSSLQDEFIVIV